MDGTERGEVAQRGFEGECDGENLRSLCTLRVGGLCLGFCLCLLHSLAEFVQLIRLLDGDHAGLVLVRFGRTSLELQGSVGILEAQPMPTEVPSP